MPHHKNHKFIFFWDIFITLLATFAAIEIPLAMVMHYGSPSWLMCINQLVTVCFVADIFIRFRSPVHHGKHPHHTGTGHKKYPKGWLLIDFLAAVPFDLVALAFSTVPGLGVLWLLRVMKVSRVVSFRKVWLNSINSNPVFVRFSFFFYFLGLAAHWAACGWLAIRGPYYDLATELRVGMINEYVKALYWAITTITTIGYGDITPDKTKNFQMIFTMAVQILGAGAYGYIIGNIANMLANIDMAKSRHQERVDRINSFMKSKKIPQNLQEQVFQYYNYLWETRKGYNDETILSELPESFRFEFAMLLNRSIIEKVPLFKGADQTLVREVIFKLKPCIYIPGDSICVAGEIGDKMYFINKGSVEVTSQDGKHVYAMLKEGDFFGEVALLMKQPRNATIRAIDYCDLYSLDKDSFDDVITNYPGFEKHIRNMAKERMQ
jgi:Cyclic nucleotide-binding domain/Ion transport protein